MMKVWALTINNRESYESWTAFVGVYASMDKARIGAHENAKENGWEVTHEYHPQLGQYRGEDTSVLCFTVSPNGYEYETIETELDLGMTDND
jgi:hypothetical protein